MAILKAIAAVVVGYIAMFGFVFATFAGAYMVLGTEGSFKEGSYDVTTIWLIVSAVLGMIAAIIGGLVCALMAGRGSKAPMVLAGLVLVLGLLMAAPLFMASDDAEPAVRTAEVNNFEAMNNAKQPPFTAVLNAVIGAVGVVIGASLFGGKKTE